MTENSRLSANPAHYPVGGTFADFIRWHMDYWGTRPTGGTTKNGVLWTSDEFRLEAFGSNAEEDKIKVGMRNWRGAGSAPAGETATTIITTFFGTNPAFAQWRNDFEVAYKNSKGPDNNLFTKKFPEPPSISTSSASIPRLTSYFLGRDDERDRIVEAILAKGASSLAILIQGGPGMGKTELSKAVAHDDRVVECFGERRWFVRLETASTADTMQDAILRASGSDRKLDLQSAFQNRDGERTLLILDNLEKPWESIEGRNETEAMLKELSEIPGISVLASFRGFDFVDGPTWHLAKLNGFSPDTSKILFSAIAGHWTTTDSCFEKFIAALGGIPLAINLVARRAHNRTSLKPLWREWEQIGADFAKHLDFPEGATTSLAYSIELSLKSPRLQAESGALRLFGFLGCLPAGLSDHDCQSLLGETAFRAEERLLNAGLADFEKNRIDLLPPIREHAKRYYALDNEDSKLWIETFLQKTLSFYKSIDKLEGNSAALDVFFDIANINAAMIEAISNEINIPVFQYFESYFILTTCMQSRIDIVIEQLKKNSNALSAEKIAYLEFMDAFMLFSEGELVKAYEIAKRNYFAFDNVDNKIGMAQCLWLGGMVMYALDENVDAVSGLEEALEIFTEYSDVMGQTSVELILISALSHLGRFDEASALIEKHASNTNKNETFYELSLNIQYFASRGDFEVCKKNDGLALEFYKKALDYANYIGYIKFELELLGVICEFYEKSDQMDLLYIYAGRLINLYNSIGDSETAEKIQNTLLNSQNGNNINNRNII